MQQFDVPFIRRQKQNTEIWKGHHFKDYSFEEERSSQIYKKQHRRKSCYCQLCGKMSLFQYAQMNLSTCINFFKNINIIQDKLQNQQELQKPKKQFGHNLSFSFRSKSIMDFQHLLFENNARSKYRKSCDCSECGTQNNFQVKCQNYQMIKKQQQSPTNQFRIKKTIKRHQFRKLYTEQFSPSKNSELRHLKKRMIELDLNDNQLLTKFQLKRTKNPKLIHHQQSLNIFEISSRQKTDILSPLGNKRKHLPYLQLNSNRSPQQRLTQKQPISNYQRDNFKKHNQQSGIF
ncbi:unnamed protein product [Paramecium octaurelia]|uniref:Uncharacterized protein n=1 Tax=Paramecium octaurelia TaxID=43137 RepID=A0A8S1SYH3_PAROT|nr:unnamed protein product [Paramecium octaurelia]